MQTLVKQSKTCEALWGKQEDKIQVKVDQHRCVQSGAERIKSENKVCSHLSRN
jgi:hypothetical protein